MRNLVAILFCSILCLSCNAQRKERVALKGTKWECQIAEGCINIYEFETDSTFTFLSCEIQDEYFGDYYFQDGFLMLDRKGSIYDENFPESSRHRAKRKLYKVEVKDDKLKHLFMSEWNNGKWRRSDFEFDDAYIYRKVK